MSPGNLRVDTWCDNWKLTYPPWGEDESIFYRMLNGSIYKIVHDEECMYWAAKG